MHHQQNLLTQHKSRCENLINRRQSTPKKPNLATTTYTKHKTFQAIEVGKLHFVKVQAKTGETWSETLNKIAKVKPRGNHIIIFCSWWMKTLHFHLPSRYGLGSHKGKNGWKHNALWYYIFRWRIASVMKSDTSSSSKVETPKAVNEHQRCTRLGTWWFFEQTQNLQNYWVTTKLFTRN